MLSFISLFVYSGYIKLNQQTSLQQMMSKLELVLPLSSYTHAHCGRYHYWVTIHHLIFSVYCVKELYLWRVQSVLSAWVLIDCIQQELGLAPLVYYLFLEHTHS